jgi:hypothetical protein
MNDRPESHTESEQQKSKQELQRSSTDAGKQIKESEVQLGKAGPSIFITCEFGTIESMRRKSSRGNTSRKSQ